jgi:hypothetical protein
MPPRDDQSFRMRKFGSAVVVVARGPRWACGLLIVGVLAGCGGTAPPPAPSPASTTTESPSTVDRKSETTAASDAPAPKKRTYAPVQLGGATGGGSTNAIAAEADAESVLEHLQPLQVLLGTWTGNARKAAQIHEIGWVWDFQTDPKQPALVMTSAKSAYLREARLTYLPAKDEFQLALTTPEGETRTLTGTFSQPVEDVTGDDKKLQRTFKLNLAEAPATEGEQWQVALHQLENNRYLIELDRRRGQGPYQRVDTIHSQREGTSFALSDTDYGDRTCIISQGLGTISVSYQGRSFWVCCTGCQAAFNDDPAKWIAKWDARQMP